MSKGYQFMYQLTILPMLLFSNAHAHDQIYEGQYTYGSEVSVFTPCNSDKDYWLEGSKYLTSDLHDVMLAAPKPYTPFYLKFRGHEHFEVVDGFQADYEFQLHLSEIITFDKKMPSGCQ